ncbi:hypothetical protein [Natrinema sp. SYSU A 869]|uniref:hypothetical protein n=1 Tax=Natrinema sp. SYSU A 869 TaxID=2871694 RepID=UPI002106FE8A|nr:hypothetical protein [Natrinema sp. SYSU A 869]
MYHRGRYFYPYLDRHFEIRQSSGPLLTLELSTNVLTQETPEQVPKIGGEEPEDILESNDLVRPDAVAWFVTFWIIGPSASAGLAYVFFLVVPL